MISQPFLFSEMSNAGDCKPAAVGVAKSKAKKLLRQLYKLRAQNTENPFAPEIQNLIDKVRRFSTATDTQVEETIMYCIEVQMAYGVTEIVEDSGIDRQTIKELLSHLESKRMVRRVPRYHPGSDRKYYIYKSNRQNIGEMADL